ncbi:MAG: purine-binding chemotaxis protein CheW [Firmicutes bacterium]|nr:purine-binding chemotaxis protein CheW [Bacillota bacterium]
MKDQTGTETKDLQLVIFTVGGNEFAIHISLVREIIHISKLVVLPNMPLSMVGIINVRGTVLPVVDLGRHFALDLDTDKDYKTRKVLLVEMEDSMVGYLVDNVSEVLRIPGNSLEESSKISGLDSGFIDAICNLEGRLIPIIDANKLLTVQETEQYETLAEEEV